MLLISIPEYTGGRILSYTDRVSWTSLLFWRKTDAQKASELGASIAGLALGTLSSMAEIASEELGRQPTDEEQFQATIELTLFLLYLVDRQAFRVLGPQRRQSFMDLTIIETLNIFNTLLKTSHVLRFATAVRDRWKPRCKTYMNYAEVPREGQPLDQMLTWQAGKRVLQAMHAGWDSETLLYANIGLQTLTKQLFKTKEYRAIR